MQGSDKLGFHNVNIWYSTEFGSTALDGLDGHSPFTQSLLESLDDNMTGKTWAGLWNEVYTATLDRTEKKQEPITIGSGLTDMAIIPSRNESLPKDQVSRLVINSHVSFYLHACMHAFTEP